jgi:THO complex subunit 2
MAPAKRKRGDRGSVDAGESRPSPHRPQNTSLGQHDRPSDMRDGGRRSSRGGAGGTGGGRNRRNESRDSPNKLTLSNTGRATPTPGPMSPPAPRPSSATHTPVQTPTPTAELPSPLSRPTQSPFDYCFLTENRLSSWEAKGRLEVIELGTQARDDEDAMDLATIFQEFTRASFDGRMDAAEAGKCVKEILGPDTAGDEPLGSFDPKTFFLDTLSLIYESDTSPMSLAVRTFVFATGISPVIMRQTLESQLLQDLGLTRDTFKRVAIRQSTNILYRQANYNLLREETEGYSKLLTELFTTSATEPPSSETVQALFERVKGLIGTFDLDVGRVLDITLDVFAAVLIKHHRFFIKLLRTSSWWPSTDMTAPSGLPNWALPNSPGWMPTEEDEASSKERRVVRDEQFWVRAQEIGLDAYFELGDRRQLDEKTKKRLLDSIPMQEDKKEEYKSDRQWIAETGTLPPSGNRVAAQLLGFKLRFYASPAREKDDLLPANLIYLMALLIKIGFVSLRDLWAHLWPADEEMTVVKEKKLKELAAKEKLNRPGGGASNALTMAGALPDDTLPNNGRTRDTAAAKPDTTAKPAAEVEDKDKLDDPTDQKIQLLTNLLTIGAIPEALFIIGRFPWLTEACPDLLDLVNRILHHSIKDVYASARPTSRNGELMTKKVANLDQSGVPKGQLRLTQIPPRKQLRWPFPDKAENETTGYKFYWEEWADDIPVCQTVDDLFTLSATFLNVSGVNIGRDASLLSKFARIGTKSLVEDRSKENLDRWQDLLKRVLVPALSLNKPNTSVANEIYAMLRFYPVPIRYSIYAEWFEGGISRLPAMKMAFARVTLETQSIMKRISKSNVPSMARALSKIAQSSPGVVLKIALSQIESYNNLTPCIVDCARYFTDLGYDVLVWSLMSALGGKSRNRNNAEFALLPSKWLLALSGFCGAIYTRYSIVDLTPILQYVNDQLYRGNATDLVILNQLIAQMGGLVPSTDYTDPQLLAMSGGEALRRHTLISLRDLRFESTKTAKRLMKSLTQSTIGGQLLIQMAQHRQAAIYKIDDSEAHIKLLATMLDDASAALHQYLDLLRSNLSTEDFDKLIPGVPELMSDFGLEPALAFLIGRASIAYRLSKAKLTSANGKRKSASPELAATKVDSEGDVDMEVVGGVAQLNGEKMASPPALTNRDSVLQGDIAVADAKLLTEPSLPEVAVDEVQAILEPLIASAQAALPEGSFKYLSPSLFVTFWTSTLSDLRSPANTYLAEIAKLLAESSRVYLDRSDMTRAGMDKKETAKKYMLDTREALTKEYQSETYAASRRRRIAFKQKNTWFSPSIKPETACDAFLEKCLLPRLLLSPSDADFCFSFIKSLHDQGTPFFRTFMMFQQIFRTNRLRSLIFKCTIREAQCLGRFLTSILSELATWHKDVKVYEKEAWGSDKSLPGFAKSVDAESKPKGLMDHEGISGFKGALFRWHRNLNSALRDCLEGDEWMHIRNAITILKAVDPVFPLIDFMGNKLIGKLELITVREKGVREDLALTGNAVLVQLKKRQKNWIMIQAFGTAVRPSPYFCSNTLTSIQLEPGQDGVAAAASSKLKPTAPEFKPQSRASSLGVGTSKILTTGEVEDGEVDDTKVSTPIKTTAPSGPSNTSTMSSKIPAAMESKKSDILESRERIKRENAVKLAAKSTPPSSTVPPRPNLPAAATLDRGSPNLPNRPDAPFPAARQALDRHPSRLGDRRDERDSRLSDPRRLDGAGDRFGDRSRPPMNDRRSNDNNSRDFGRPSDRADRDRRDLPPWWNGEPARDNLERAPNTNRPVDNGRLSRDMPPPRSGGVNSDRSAPSTSDPRALINPDRQELINPARAALISGDIEVPRPESPRRSRDEPRLSSNPQSPRRHAEKGHSDTRNDDRSHRNGPVDSYSSSSRTRTDDQPPPAGPRGDRAGDRGSERSSNNDRTPFQPPPQLPRSIDPGHGRLNASSRQQPDPNFGRLNTTPVADIPSGPRDRHGMRGNRMDNASPPMQQPRQDRRTAADIHRPPTPEKQPPTGPSAGRHLRGRSSGQFDPISTIQGVTQSTPTLQSSATGVHPDRLKQVGPTPVQPSPPIHPDRLRDMMGNDSPAGPPSGGQFNNSRSRPHVPSVNTAGPPSGPKSTQSSPIGPLSGTNGFAAPTGPASATERAARGGRRQLQGINSMLQQVGQQNASDRNPRRGRMSSGLGPDTPMSAPQTPIVAPPPPPLSVQESPANSVGHSTNPPRADLITGSTPSTDERGRDKSSRRERSGHHSRRSSQSPGRERDSKPRLQEYRDRREPEKVRPSHGRDLMEAGDGRDPASGRDSARERERRSGGRRDNREKEPNREPHNSSWASERDRPIERGADRTSDHRASERGGSRHNRDTRAGEERRESGGGRKRQSEEVMESRGHDKRPRR